MMMTRRPWPPLYRQPAVFSSNESAAAAGVFARQCSLDRSVWSCENAARYGMALHRKDYHYHGSKKYPRDCYFVASAAPPPPPPIYRTPVNDKSFAAVPFLPAPVKLLVPQHVMCFDRLMDNNRAVVRDRDVHRGYSKQLSADKCRLCSCAKIRSRSLENLCFSDNTTSTTTTTTSNSANTTDQEEVYFRRRRKQGKENFKRRSMDNLLETRKQYRKKNTRQDGDGQSNNGSRPRFLPVTTLEDVQAIRCAEFHPQGNLYAVGSNSKTLRICAYPKLHDLRDDHKTCQPTVLFKRTKHHKGSLYCMAWTPTGDILATGSNDKTVKLMKFNNDTANFEGQEIELAMHDGTVRDVCFLEDTSNKSSLLISGGAGDCKIYVTDCATGQPYQALSGHSGHVLSLYNWGGVIFASGSQDRTVRFWDLRTRGCVNVITPITTNTATKQGSPVAAVCVDPSGRLLVSGHEDSSCVLFDIRGARTLQSFKPHSADVRSIRFSPSAYYLLTAGYDNKLVLTDLQGDLTIPLPSVVVAQHQDKVISGRWHPAEFSFLSTSADKTATLWALPPI